MDTAEPIFVSGSPQSSGSADTIPVVNPATGQRVGLIPAGCAEDVDAAVSAACAAAPAWAHTDAQARAAAVVLALEALGACTDDLAQAQSIEMGQPVDLARTFLEETLTGAVEELKEPLPSDRTELDGGYLVHEPRGVAALIVPWNFPLPVAIQGLVPLLATGNTVVWKPSERSPLSAVLAMRAIGDALPAGTLNMILGDARAGEPLASHAGVDVVLFTGSTRTGQRVAQLAAKRLAKVILELGGKDPVIVDSDVDPGWAAAVVAEGSTLNAGQICTSMERVYVHGDIAEQFIGKLCEEMSRVSTGPLVDERQREVVDRQVKAALDDGARLLLGGVKPRGTGFFYPPTVVADVPQHTPLMNEETFGPVAAVRTVDTFDEALALANETTYGLAATVLTRNPIHASRASELRAAIVWVNEWQGGVPGAQGEPQGLSGLGLGFGPGLLDELRTTRYVHSGEIPEG